MSDPIDAPVAASVLHRLRDQGLLSPDALRHGAEAMDLPPTPTAWATFVDRLLLFLGAALVLAGTIYFFAYNWDELGRFLQMGVLLGAIAAAAGAAWGRLDRLVGKALVLGAAVLVGPLLGVFGTTYQTGADPYGLFLGWAGLTLVWAAVARLPALWVVQVVLWNVTLVLYYEQVLAAEPFSGDALPYHLCALMNGVTWLAWEGAGRVLPWMHARWTPRVFVAAALVPVVTTTCLWIVDDLDEQWFLGPVLLAGLLAAIYGVGRHLLLDRGLLAMGATALIVVSSTALGRVAWEIVDEADEELLAVAIFGLGGLVVAAKVAAAARWITHLEPLADTKEAA